MNFEKEYRLDHPETVGEKDKEFDRYNYQLWLETKYAAALKNMESSSRVIHSKPQDGCYYWVQRDKNSQWELALAWDYPHGIAFELEGGEHIQYEHIGRWKKTPIPEANEAYYG